MFKNDYEVFENLKNENTINNLREKIILKILYNENQNLIDYKTRCLNSNKIIDKIMRSYTNEY